MKRNESAINILHGIRKEKIAQMAMYDKYISWGVILLALDIIITSGVYVFLKMTLPALAQYSIVINCLVLVLLVFLSNQVKLEVINLDEFYLETELKK